MSFPIPASLGCPSTTTAYLRYALLMWLLGMQPAADCRQGQRWRREARTTWSGSSPTGFAHGAPILNFLTASIGFRACSMVCYLDLSGNDLGDPGIQCISSNLPLSHITSLSLCKVHASCSPPSALLASSESSQVGMKDDAAALLANAIPKSSLVSLLVRWHAVDRIP